MTHHQRARLYADLNEEQQRALLTSASASLLHEAYFIEKLGLAFGAKMVLLSSTTEERMLYALFCADEARHLAAVSEHIDDPESLATSNPFHALLSEVGGRARFFGQYDNAELPRLMGTVDWVVVPSVWWENSPLVIHEAQTIPARGTVFSFHGFRFEVAEGEENRLTMLKIRKL